MTNYSSLAMAVAMITALPLLVFGIKLARSSETRQRGLLMVAAAVVLIMNVMIWTV